jgi:hypothetical protein
MSHFAKLNQNNIVIFVTVGRQEDDGKEAELCERTGDTYKQTSFNTRAGVYYDPATGEPAADQSKAFRGNFASVGYSYDEALDAFIPPKPFNSWLFDAAIFGWKAPVAYPTDGFTYLWNETSKDWQLADFSEQA